MRLPRTASDGEFRRVAAFRPVTDTRDGFRVLGRVAGQDVETQRGIADAAGDGSDDVAVGCERHDAGIGHQRESRFDADQALRRCGVLDRPSRFFGEAQHRHAGRDRGGRAGAAAAGQELASGRIIGRPRPTVVGMTARMAQDRHVGLAEDHRPGRLHAGHHGRVGAGHQVDAAGLRIEKPPARRGREPDHVHRILHDDRHAVERPERPAGSTALVARPRIGESVRVEEDDGVIIRVEAGDAVEESLGEGFGRRRAGREGALHLFDGEFDEVEGRGGCACAHDRVPF